MSTIQILERRLTEAELARLFAGTAAEAKEPHNLYQPSEQYGAVALDGDNFVGSALGFVYRQGNVYNGWMYLDELYVEKPYRGQGLGAALLRLVENQAVGLGITRMRTATSYAVAFYLKQGYRVMLEEEQRYPSGHSQFALRKTLAPAPLTPKCREIRLVERLMTDTEFQRMEEGFAEQDREYGNPYTKAPRREVVALDGDAFIGCASGLVYHKCFYLTNLFVEKAYRGQGLERTVLQAIEKHVAAHGTGYLCTWIATGDVQMDIFRQQGYTPVCEVEGWYFSGESQIALRKTL